MISLLERAQIRFPERDGFKVTQSLVDDVKTELKSFKNTAVKIASKLGVPINFVRFVQNETHSPSTVFTVHSPDGWGREELRDYIVTRKKVGNDWSPEEQRKILPYRDDYDAGLIEMCQGRDGDFVIQYAIPRKKQITRTHKYFQIEEEYGA